MNSGRALEILLMPGFVLAAIPFAGEIPARLLLKNGVSLFLGSLLLVKSIYAVNSYFEFQADQLNPRLHSDQAKTRGHYTATAIGTLCICLLAFRHIDSKLPYLAVASFLLWLIYSLPSGAKSRPIWGTAIHFLSQIVQFHLGIIVFSQVTWSSFLVSIYFAIIFACGHLMHELKDFEADRAAGIRTNVVAYGPSRVLSFYRKALIVTPLYWAALFGLKMIGMSQFLPFFLATIGHAVASRYWDGRWPKENESFQKVYRAIYLVAGLVTFAVTRF